MKDRVKYLLRAISSRDSNSDREYTTPKHPKLLIPGYDAEVEEIDSALDAKPRWNKGKRSLTLLRKNSIRFLRARLEKVTCPKILSYNARANIAIDEGFSIRYQPELDPKESRTWPYWSAGEISPQPHQETYNKVKETRASKNYRGICNRNFKERRIRGHIVGARIGIIMFLLFFHSLVLSVLFLVFISVLCQLPVL